VNSPGAAHDTRLHVVSKEVKSTIEYVCKVGVCMETHDQVGVRKHLKHQRFSNKKMQIALGSKVRRHINCYWKCFSALCPY